MCDVACVRIESVGRRDRTEAGYSFLLLVSLKARFTGVAGARTCRRSMIVGSRTGRDPRPRLRACSHPSAVAMPVALSLQKDQTTCLAGPTPDAQSPAAQSRMDSGGSACSASLGRYRSRFGRVGIGGHVLSGVQSMTGQKGGSTHVRSKSLCCLSTGPYTPTLQDLIV